MRTKPKGSCRLEEERWTSNRDAPMKLLSELVLILFYIYVFILRAC